MTAKAGGSDASTRTDGAREIDAVIVTYNSAATIAGCLQTLVDVPGMNVVVVDNASSDATVDVVARHPVRLESLPDNHGFAYANNIGYSLGDAPYVLFINPDATISEDALQQLVAVLQVDERVAIAAPRINNRDGSLSYSLRRFPRLRSTYAQALFLHRLGPERGWSDELVRTHDAYATAHAPEWVSGACMLVRRSHLKAVGGWDSGFFLYCEDIDLCRRMWDEGFEIRYVPDAIVTHVGGASSPRSMTIPILAASRIRYATKHRARPAAVAERLGVALGALTHMVAARGGMNTRRAHARSLLVSLPGRSGVDPDAGWHTAS